MSFDQNSDLPIVNLHKRTTKVNLSMIIAVIAFFIITAAVIFWISRHEASTVNAVHEKSESSR